jgi:hypothetical protein
MPDQIRYVKYIIPNAVHNLNEALKASSRVGLWTEISDCMQEIDCRNRIYAISKIEVRESVIPKMRE